MTTASPYLRRCHSHQPCEGCGLRANGVVLVQSLLTGETLELALCARCRATPERTVWRRYEPAAR